MSKIPEIDIWEVRSQVNPGKQGRFRTTKIPEKAPDRSSVGIIRGPGYTGRVQKLAILRLRLNFHRDLVAPPFYARNERVCSPSSGIGTFVCTSDILKYRSLCAPQKLSDPTGIPPALGTRLYTQVRVLRVSIKRLARLIQTCQIKRYT